VPALPTRGAEVDGDSVPLLDVAELPARATVAPLLTEGVTVPTEDVEPFPVSGTDVLGVRLPPELVTEFPVRASDPPFVIPTVPADPVEELPLRPTELFGVAVP